MKRRKNRRISWFLALCMLLTVLQTPLVALAEEMQTPQPTEMLNLDEDEQTPTPEPTATSEQSPALQEAAEQAQEEKAAAVPAVQTVEEDGLNTDAEGYLLITGADELAKVMNDTATYADKNLRLAGSLDMAGQAVQPLGNSSTPFTGTFDGAGYTISNLRIQASGGYTGMFGRMDGTVKNLTLNKADIEDTNESYTKGTGALVGHNKGTISDCLVKNSEIKVHYNGLGGLVGYNEGTAERCGVENSTITAASVASMAYTGGFAGQNAANGKLIQCYVEGGKVCYTGVAAKGQEVGGFVGRNASSTSVIQNCYSTAEVAANGDKAGGFIGNANAGSIETVLPRAM
ncbi:MAG: GLUG motif-containing protein [Acutalibacteraceae bacterium]